MKKSKYVKPTLNLVVHLPELPLAASSEQMNVNSNESWPTDAETGNPVEPW